MRKLPAPVIVALSAALHVGVGWWVTTFDHPPPPTADLATGPAPVPVPVIELVPAVAPPAPLEVALLDDEPPPALALPAAASPSPTTPGRSAAPPPPASSISTGATTTTGPETAGPPTDNPARNPWLDMRRPGAPRAPGTTVVLPRLRYQDADDVPHGAPPVQPDVTTGQLAPSGGGTHRADQGAFVASVDADGNVDFHDSKNVRIRVALPTPKQLGRIVGDWYEDPNKPIGFLPPDHLERAPVLNNNESSGQDKKRDHGDVATVPIFAGGFDATDALMRRHGQDPYASKKLKFLDSTRDERAQIGMRHRRAQLALAPEIMQRNLARLWASVGDPAARREALFELWDECAESGTDELVAAGAAARTLVIGWIRAHLPAGSDVAFTAAELATYNQRKASTATFAPY